MHRLSILFAVIFTSALGAQPMTGKYALAGGGNTTLVLEQGNGGVTGSLSVAGTTFAVQGKLEGAEIIHGTMKAGVGSVFFEAERKGTQLTLILIDAGPNGQPDYTRAQELRFVRQDDVAAAKPSLAESMARGATASSSAGAPSKPSAAPPPVTPSGVTKGATQQDQQLIDLLLSSAWCSYSYSGGTTYTGGSGGTERTKRTVFGRDGLVTERSGSESVNTGAPGAVWGNSSDTKQAHWRVQNGMLMLSLDGVQWAPQPLQITLNSNGYPIVKTNGTEYFMCR